MYNYSFYKGYTLAKKLKNREDTPVLFSSMTVCACLFFNIITLLFLLEALTNKNFPASTIVELIASGKYIFGIIASVGVWFYYSYGERWKRIITRYSRKAERRNITIHPVIVLVAYYSVSFALLLMAGMFKNGDGIFKP